jgi:hypothetical protein
MEQDDDDVVVCIICLGHTCDGLPPPIHSGCACRGDAALVHVACRIQAAKHRQQSSGCTTGWEECDICHQIFHGEMAIELGEEFLRETAGRPELAEEWFAASEILSNALLATGEYARAEALVRETIPGLQQAGFNTDDDAKMCALRRKLGHALGLQGKHADAQVIYQHCLTNFTHQFGPDDERTLGAGKALGDSLRAQSRLTEANVILTDILERSKRVHGPSSIVTFDCSNSLATVSSQHPV